MSLRWTRVNREQKTEEVTTFRRFAQVCPVEISSGSITTRNPPEPDIICEFTATQEEVAFELVEIVDERFVRLESDQSQDMGSLRAAYRASPPELRAALDERLGNAIVSVAFEHALPSRERQASIPVVLHELAVFDPTYVGEWRPRSDSPLHQKVRYIRVLRGESQGPDFYVDANTSIGDPTVERVRAKWLKAYRTAHPIELLAHYELQPVAPEVMWLPELRSFIEANWATGPFRRVWLFDWLFDSWSQKILYTAVRPGAV